MKKILLSFAVLAYSVCHAQESPVKITVVRLKTGVVVPNDGNDQSFFGDSTYVLVGQEAAYTIKWLLDLDRRQSRQIDSLQGLLNACRKVKYTPTSKKK